MMKLELKHLSGYLPYGLKGNLENLEYYDTVLNKELYRIETGKTENSKTYDVMVIVGDEEGNLIDFKPILRPLSDLTKEIEVNGKKFVSITELLRNSNFAVDKMSFEEQCDYLNIYEHIPCVSWSDIELLFEWHFDIYGLIGKGLAIDINTLP